MGVHLAAITGSDYLEDNREVGSCSEGGTHCSIVWKGGNIRGGWRSRLARCSRRTVPEQGNVTGATWMAFCDHKLYRCHTNVHVISSSSSNLQL